ncbi:MAG: hypothetical protein JWN03_4300 [Nocardia sp.]|uniref:hypothetical protein n=1 Tax=Nocardia sp. TaxID=1821 RepID=UPI0026373755|nr:hypothetical protein [Nocardia sp.]MCU1644025.1 hypothetical protein [Nocardia sp.]
MTWIAEPIGYANPDYYRDAANSTERQLRADFAKYYQLREIAPFGLTAADTAELNAHADTLAARWGRHESPHFRRTWESLQSAVMGWEARPDLARRNFDQLARARSAGELAIDEDLWRSLQQARAITGHGHDTTTAVGSNAGHRFPNLYPPEPSLSPPAEQGPDLRTSVERTLGAPRDIRSATPQFTLEQIDATIAATEEVLDAERQRGDLDTGHDARTALLPRVIRDAPISYNYGESAAWELRQAALLREIQDLSCEHSTVAEAFDGHDDQARILRLEALRDGAAAARRDALRAGVHAADIDRAYLLGRDGIYWSTEPSHPRLGRIAQLTEERDRALSTASRNNIADSGVHQGPGPHLELTSAIENGSETTRPNRFDTDVAATDGTRIVEAIDAVLADIDDSTWTAPVDPPQPSTPASIERDMGADL